MFSRVTNTSCQAREVDLGDRVGRQGKATFEIILLSFGPFDRITLALGLTFLLPKRGS